jgi:periplasmic protein TonB
VADNRSLHYAIAASLALHAVVLVSVRDLIDTARRAASIPPQIIARLMEPEPPAAVPAPPVQPAPPAPPEKKKRAAPKKPAPVISTPQPAPTPAPAAPAPLAPPVVAEAPAPQPAPPAVAAQESRPAPPAQPALPPESLSRDQYRLQLIHEARRHKRYPPLARENNWQGDVRVDVAVAANGRPTVRLKESSGYDVLDRQALDMFAQAARSVPVPPELRGKEFSLELKAVYGLED